MYRSAWIVWCSLVVACAPQQRAQEPRVAIVPAPQAAALPMKRTLAEEVLAIEEPLLPTRSGTLKLLETLTRDVRTRLAAEAPRPEDTSEEGKAERTLAMIEEVLVEHHFVYPGLGYVTFLHDGLADVTVDAYGKHDLLRRYENSSAARQKRIEANTSSPFHIADCDIYSVLYVSIGEELGLPISMVDLPGPIDGGVGHNYVVWKLSGDRLLRWEADTGSVRSEYRDLGRFEQRGALSYEAAKKHRTSGVPMTRDEVLGYFHWNVGLAWYERGAPDVALKHFEIAISRWPSPKPLNTITWLLATSSDPAFRDPKRAVLLGERLKKLWPSANYLDTVAAAYAASERWGEAVLTQRQAMAAANEKERPSFEQRLEMFEHCQPYFEPRANELAARNTRGALRDYGWRELMVTNAETPKRIPLENRCRQTP